MSSSMRPCLSVAASLNVAWPTFPVFLMDIVRSFLAGQSLDTTWSARVPRISSRWIRSRNALTFLWLYPHDCENRNFCPSDASGQLPMGLITTRGNRVRKELFIVDQRRESVNFQKKKRRIWYQLYTTSTYILDRKTNVRQVRLSYLSSLRTY